MCVQCAFRTLKHIMVIVAQLHKNFPDYNVFQCVSMCLQCASNVPLMCFHVFSMCFVHIGNLPKSQCAGNTLETHENTLAAHWRPIECAFNGSHLPVSTTYDI